MKEYAQWQAAVGMLMPMVTVASSRTRRERSFASEFGFSFAAVDVRGLAVLVQTGWDRNWGTDQYFEGHPFLTEQAAKYLADAGAELVGIDSLNIDDTAVATRPVHSVLLGAGIPIVEHLTSLDNLPVDGF